MLVCKTGVVILIKEVKNNLSNEIISLLDIYKRGTLISIDATGNSDILTIDIHNIEIPQYPVFDVRKTERIHIKIRDNILPEVFCRKDFPIVPHLNLLEDGQKTLCLFDVPFNEIKHIFNASMLIKRIVYWFEKTARGELHQPDQALEPYFPYVTNLLFLSPKKDLPFVKLDEIPNEQYRILRERPLHFKNSGKIHAIIYATIEKGVHQNILNSLPKNLRDLDIAFEDRLIEKISEELPYIWSVKQNTKMYRLLFNQSEVELKKSSVMLIVDIIQETKKASKDKNHTYKAFLIEGTYQNLYKSLGYRVEKNQLVKRMPTGDFSSLKLSPFDFIFNLNPNYANLYNGLDKQFCNKKIVQIGLGSLGSQIANNCIRAGYGKWIYIDPDVLFPHNLARHCLTESGLGKNKAILMKEYSESIFDATAEYCVEKAMPEDIFNSNYSNDFINEIKNSSLVVDCSASVAVERYLCHNLANNTRCISFFMNPSGTSLIMLLEDTERKVKLDMLEMQYYSIIINNETLYDHLKSNQKVIYSSSCRNSSLKYSQDNVAIFSGIASKFLKNINQHSDSMISIWTFDGLSIKSFNEPGILFVDYNQNDWNIKISSSLESKLFSIRKSKLPNETGGILLGSFDFEQKICYIVDTINAPNDSQEFPCAFIRGSKGLLKQIEKIEEITVGNITYIGEWHSHPTDNTHQSSEDKALLEYIAEYNYTQCQPGCMLIVGETHFDIYIN